MSDSYERFTKKQIIEKSFDSLSGLLEGIDADKVINTKEVEGLKKWFSDNLFLKDKTPFTEVFSLFSEIISDNLISNEEFENLKWLCNKFKASGEYYCAVTKEIQFLHGLIAGLAVDDVLNEKEVQKLKVWLSTKMYLKKTWPFDEVYGLCTRVMADGVIDADEKSAMIGFFKEFLNLNNSSEGSVPVPSTLLGICVFEPEITFEYKRFVITGKSKKASRNHIKKLIEDCAGTVDDRVTSKTDYLIVMDEGNPAWAFSAYGRKIEEAMHLRKQGREVIIVNESDLWDALYDADVA